MAKKFGRMMADSLGENFSAGSSCNLPNFAN